MNVYLQADYAWEKTKHSFNKRLMDEKRTQKMKAWMVRGGYIGGWSLGDNKGAYSEDMLYGELHKMVPLKNDILLSSRIRMDNRWVGGEPTYSFRLRLRVMLEKEYTAGRLLLFLI